MLLGGLELVIGKAILGKIFAGAAAKTIAGAAIKTGIGLAAKAEMVHHAVHAVDAIGNALDAASAVDTASTFSSAASPLSSPLAGVDPSILNDGLAGGPDDLGEGAYPRPRP